jgi:hypothetical protein
VQRVVKAIGYCCIQKGHGLIYMNMCRHLKYTALFSFTSPYGQYQPTLPNQILNIPAGVLRPVNFTS